MSFFRRAGALIARFFTSPADPVAAAGEFQLYSKIDGNGDAQLYGRSDDGTISRITPVINIAALVDGPVINTDAALSNVFTVTLGGNRTLADPTNLVAGGTYIWVVRQDGTGSRTLAYGPLFAWLGGTPTLSTAPNSIDTITAIYDGTDLLASLQKGYL